MPAAPHAPHRHPQPKLQAIITRHPRTLCFRAVRVDDLALHAGHLALRHPDGTERTWKSPLPEDWKELMETFGWGAETAFLRD